MALFLRVLLIVANRITSYGNPEYLHDEPVIEQVCIFHVHEVGA